MTVGSLAHGRSWSGRATGLALVTVLIVLAGVWIGGDILYGTVERLAEELERPEESTRVLIWADALGLWRDAPALGTGLATFGVAFPRFRTLQAPVVFSHAESDWVQLLTDTGAVGLGLALAAVASLGLALLRRYRHTESRWARALALAGLVALGGTVVQGIANYNLPVMSNFIYLALAVALAARSSDGGGNDVGAR
jgi:O-antigen ligase